MRKPVQLRPLHRHKAVTRHFLAQREGIPYEMERTLCSECSRVLGEKQLRRATA